VPRPNRVQPAVEALLQRERRHGWSIDEVTAALEHQGQRADYSSVFRALERLADDGALRRVDHGDAKTRYEENAGHHDHFRCTSCGDVQPLPTCLIDEALGRLEAMTGGTVTDHQLLVSGRCAACSGE
jgi:Fe2+ or Zn2+ uptake regulation protein